MAAPRLVCKCHSADFVVEDATSSGRPIEVYESKTKAPINANHRLTII